MSELGSERSKPWNIYSTSDPAAPSQTGEIDREAPWKSFGTSMNAISFGFVATAILISMFLIMAIFEHLFRPNPSFSTPQEVTNGSSESRPLQKLGNPQTVSLLEAFKLCISLFYQNESQVPAAYASDFSVVMPGQQLPTYIAQPAPLPCPRENIYWPNHENIV
ncbi:hypothetical protein DKX38_001659 [Salix brachista]|uniref:Uncharacterized protein n=1 Tax=Salix brachista TaxID=2182728 RepID=A0A5N5P401_9ROSI|nr:hypothetical protein DKX38_001659 [Salix brachista]